MNNLDTQPSDHDVLITLNANFQTFTKQYQLDMAEIKNGTSARLAEHEIRLHKLEAITNEVKPIETVAEFRALQKNWNDFVVSTKTARWFIGLITAVLGSAFTLIVKYLLDNFL